MQKQIEFDIDLNIFTANDYEVDAYNINLFEEYSFNKAKLIVHKDFLEIKQNAKTFVIQKKLIIKFDWIEKNKSRFIFETSEKMLFIPLKRIYTTLIKFKYLDMENAKTEMLKFNEQSSTSLNQ